MTQTRRNIFLLLFSKPQFTYKSVITALAINKNIWPSNGSHTLNMQSLGLMFNNYFDLNNSPPLQSDHYGYPNLGRPNDHFEVTPFEAIFCGPRIQRHIRLNEAAPFYVDSLKQFVLNEVEPWYLGLRNMRIGSQARSDYRYYSYRRAKHRIVVGDSVTPTTDYGAFIVEPNGKLTLHAGDVIQIDKIHLKQGSIVHIVPGYTQCGNTKMLSGRTENTNTTQRKESKLMTKGADVNEQVEAQDYIIYPNPAEQTVTIKSNNGSIADEVVFYNLQGNKVLQSIPERSITTIDLGNLKSGVYIIRITSEGRMFNKKIVVR